MNRVSTICFPLLALGCSSQGYDDGTVLRAYDDSGSAAPSIASDTAVGVGDMAEEDGDYAPEAEDSFLRLRA